MDEAERQQLRELLRAHQSRLQVLELQQAAQGIQTPPQVITEIADIRAEIAQVEARLGHSVPVVNRAALRQLRQRALTAFYAKEWERAEELLDQVVQADPGDADAQAKLTEAQQQLDLGAFYQAVCDLRDAGNWRAVLDALADLERHQPGSLDPAGLRPWAEEYERRERIDSARNQVTAGHFAQALDQLGGILRRQSAVREAAVLVAALIERPAVPFDQRLRAADIAGHVGDPRIPVAMDEWHSELARRNEDFGNPPGYWCYVRPGTYHIGGWNVGEPSAHIPLPAFWIARYPITVAQYAPFVQVGYDEKAQHWWTPDGWGWKVRVQHTQPRGWNTLAHEGPNLPIYGITWYEALTFTEWLTAHLGEALPPGYVVRLPTEAEWEVAAAYDSDGKRRLYPWGKETPDPERAVYDASKLGRPAPVGCCPAGAAACGALDLCGNVWEATVSDYRGYPARSGQRVDNVTSDDYEVAWRGGAWWGDRTLVWCGARDGLRPSSGFGISVGFRVVLAAPQPLAAVRKLSEPTERQ